MVEIADTPATSCAPEPQSGLVSVVISTFNGGAYLQTAIQSILRQTYASWELLVIDDGSTDGSVAAAQARFSDERIRWFRQPNQGKPVAMNLALRELRGEFYALQDADDVSLPHRLEALVAAMRNHPSVAGVFSGYELIIQDQHLAPRCRAKSPTECREDIEQYSMPSLDPTAMYRMSYVRDLTYNETYRIGQGLDYILRIGEQHPLLVVGDVLYGYRIHSVSITKRDPARRNAAIRQVLSAAAARRYGGDEASSATFSAHDASADNDLSVHFLESVHDLKALGRVGEAFQVAWRCLQLGPARRTHYKPLVLAMLPLPVVDWVRQRQALRRKARILRHQEQV